MPALARYGTEDGLGSSDCSFSGQNSAWTDTDGEMWVATTKGLTMIPPAAPEEPSSVSPALLDRIVVNGVDADLAKLKSFGPSINRIDIHYTAIALGHAEDMKFRYKLEGWDEKWVEAGSRKTASYTNLPRGRYVFHVATSNRFGPWNEMKTPLGFDILGHSYQEPWFYLTAVLLIGATLVVAHYRRLTTSRAYLAQVMRHRLGERARIARDIHDTLLQGVIGLSLVLDSAEQGTADPEMRRTLTNALKQIDHLVADTRLAMLEMRPAGLERRRLAEALVDFSSSIESRFHLKCSVQIDVPVAMIADPVESELFRIAQEATMNAVRHAKASSVHLALEIQRRWVTLCVEDDGCGFDPAGPSSGSGLRNIRERAERLGGTAAISSSSNGGTKITVRFPIPSRFRSQLRRLSGRTYAERDLL